MNLQTSIQLYNGKKDNTGASMEIEKIIQTITGPSLKPFILTKIYQQLQAETDPERAKVLQKQYDDAKGKLPAVTWAGTFTKRKADSLAIHSKLIVLDIDKVDGLDELKEKICLWHHTFICFTSPSGAGLKVVVKIDGGPEQHKDYFLDLQATFQSKFNVAIDPSGKDLNRLCFLCHDPYLWLNEKAGTYQLPLQTAIPTTPQVKLNKKQQNDLQATGEDLYSVIHFTDQLSMYVEGNRNSYLHLFACNANRKGYSLVEVQGFSAGHFSDLPQDEIEATVRSAYQHNAHEHGKFKKIHQAPVGNRKPPQTAENPAGVSQQKSPSAAGKEDYVKFWKESKITKGQGENKYTITNYQIKRVEFTDFLFQQGFHLIETDGQGYQICYSKDGIIEPVEPRHIKKHVFNWCKQFVPKEVEEMLRSGQKQFFAANEMDALHTKAVELKKDTETESYFYFNNCWVTVHSEGIICRPYTELKQYIWAGTKKAHDFTEVEPLLLNPDTLHLDPAHMDCEFTKFIYYVGWNPNSPEEKDFEKETIEQRFKCICSAIGFMLDGYKHPADRKGIFAVDHKIGDLNEQNGRTGKSIIPKALERMKVVANINGKNFDPKYQFRYEPITMDAQVINFNDMPKNFDVESIFEIIADDYSVNRRNNGFLQFKYESSPKPWISTNFTPKGAGDSYAARMHIIEFSDYFNARHSPYDEFGHGMFSSAWDQQEWNRFYNFMLWCVMLYKKEGLLPYPNSNFDARKLVSEVNTEFIDFMDSDKVLRNERVKKHALLEEFNKEYTQLYSAKLKPHTFYKWVKQYCKHHGLFFNPHKAGALDKSNGTEYYTIATKADFKPTEVGQAAMFPPPIDTNGI